MPQRIRHDVLRWPREEERAQGAGSWEGGAGSNVSQAALETMLVARALLLYGMMRSEPVDASCFPALNYDFANYMTGQPWPEQIDRETQLHETPLPKSPPETPPETPPEAPLETPPETPLGSFPSGPPPETPHAPLPPSPPPLQSLSESTPELPPPPSPPPPAQAASSPHANVEPSEFTWRSPFCTPVSPDQCPASLIPLASSSSSPPSSPQSVESKPASRTSTPKMMHTRAWGEHSTQLLAICSIMMTNVVAIAVDDTLEANSSMSIDFTNNSRRVLRIDDASTDEPPIEMASHMKLPWQMPSRGCAKSLNGTHGPLKATTMIWFPVPLPESIMSDLYPNAGTRVVGDRVLLMAQCFSSPSPPRGFKQLPRFEKPPLDWKLWSPEIDHLTRLLAVCITASLWLRLVLHHQAVMGRVRRARVARARIAPSSAAKHRHRVRAISNAEALRSSDGSKKRVLPNAALLPQRCSGSVRSLSAPFRRRGSNGGLLLLLVLAQCLCGTRANEFAVLKDDGPVRNPSADDMFHAGLRIVAPPPSVTSVTSVTSDPKPPVSSTSPPASEAAPALAIEHTASEPGACPSAPHTALTHPFSACTP